MPEFAWEQLSIESAQVLFCDLQKSIVAHNRTTSPSSLSSAAGALLRLAKLFSLPVLRSVVPEGKNPPELIAELDGGAGLVPPLTRTTASLFADSPTQQAIAKSGRRVLIIAGFMVEGVVLASALDACRLGYEVVIPVDACGGSSQRTEQAAIRQMEAAGAVTTSVVAIGARLQPDFSTELGQQMFSIVQNIDLG